MAGLHECRTSRGRFRVDGMGLGLCLVRNKVLVMRGDVSSEVHFTPHLYKACLSVICRFVVRRANCGGSLALGRSGVRLIFFGIVHFLGGAFVCIIEQASVTMFFSVRSFTLQWSF